jgi:molecular chaperone GrpE
MTTSGSEGEAPRIVDRRSSSREDRGGRRVPEKEGMSESSKTEEEKTPAADDLAAQLRQEKEKASSYLASWQRAAADYQNYKRRVEQEREEVARRANAAFVINVLPILDDLERALQSVDSHLAGLTWVDGIRLIYRKFQAVLEMSGVTEIEADGADFDPALHEAVMFGKGESGKVISVVQKGYKLGDRVIRPAMVVVGKGEDDGQQE